MNTTHNSEATKLKRAIGTFPSWKLGFGLAMVGFVLAEVTFASDYAFLRNHNLSVQKAWLFQLQLLPALACFLVASWTTRLQKFRGNRENFRALCYSLAVMGALFSMVVLQDIAESIGRAKALLIP
jgi:hypothetical protein